MLFVFTAHAVRFNDTKEKDKSRDCGWSNATGRLVLLSCLLGLACGCNSVGYVAQAVRGHCDLSFRQQSCDRLIANPDTPPELKRRLELARQLCNFAESDLDLKTKGNYQRYADLKRPYVVWNVYAAPEFSVAGKTWWYPFVGSFDYRGYFREQSARNYAAGLRARGLDVYVEGATAYSTLGWFKDPLLNTFINFSDAAVAETIFHELAHGRLYVKSDSDFNEAFATCVGQEGARRWLAKQGDATALQRYEAAIHRNNEFTRLTLAARDKLELLYEDHTAGGGPVDSSELRSKKARIFAELRRDHAALKQQWGGHSEYDAWFAEGLNNAKLNSVATYYDLVPAFERLLAENDGDLKQFHAAVKALSKLPRKERHRRLRAGRSNATSNDEWIVPR